MIRWIIFLTALSMTTSTLAVDATRNITEIIKSGRWQVVEFAAQKQLIFRISSNATNFEGYNIVFDFAPSEKCEPIPAVMISQQGSYSPNLDEGFVPLAYKLPGQKEFIEITKTSMQQGDIFAFFQFKKLTAKFLLQSRDKGNLAIWIPESGDGTVKRSENIFFSLNGFTTAYGKARKLCNENR